MQIKHHLHDTNSVTNLFINIYRIQSRTYKTSLTQSHRIHVITCTLTYLHTTSPSSHGVEEEGGWVI